MLEMQSETSVSGLAASQQLETWADLPGRRCFIIESGQIGTIVSVEEEGGYKVRHSSTDREVHHYAADVVRALPEPGERVALYRAGQQLVAGVWLGDQDGEVAVLTGDGNVIEWILAASDLPDMAVSPYRSVERADGTSQPIDALATETYRLARSLHEAHTKCNRIQREQRAWIDQLVESAHEYADDADLCGTFDNFMERQGLPVREKSHDVDVTVSVELTIYDVMARDAEDAEQKISTEHVHDALRDIPHSRIDWDIS